MFFCPNCHKEIRYISAAPSTGKAGEPIVVDVTPEYLITESGRRMMGFREHFCSGKEPIEGIINDSPKGK
jgi:hypothetical protein